MNDLNICDTHGINIVTKIYNCIFVYYSIDVMDQELLTKYIDELEKQQLMMNDDNVPLTKVKKSKVVEEVKESAAVVEEKKPAKVKKPRPPKTQKQMEAFSKMKESRDKKIVQKTIAKKIEAGKLALEQLKSSQPQKEVSKKEVKVKSDSSSSVEIIRKKKKKRVIIEDSSSDSEIEIVKTKSKPKQQEIQQPETNNSQEFGKSHKNRNSAVKVYDEPKKQIPQQNNYAQPRNFFCD